MAGSGWQEIWQQGDGYDDYDDNGYLYDVKICSKLIMYLSNGIYIYVYICRIAMYLNATGMHYDHSQYVTHLAKIRKLEEILSL